MENSLLAVFGEIQPKALYRDLTQFLNKFKNSKKIQI